jgi:hypothetical protein
MPVGVIDTVGGDLPLPLGGGHRRRRARVRRRRAGRPLTPFWLAIDTDTPYERATAQWQKEQSDQQPEAGEQSLSGWWTRSQMSFHFGAGPDLPGQHRPPAAGGPAAVPDLAQRRRLDPGRGEAAQRARTLERAHGRRRCGSSRPAPAGWWPGTVAWRSTTVRAGSVRNIRLDAADPGVLHRRGELLRRDTGRGLDGAAFGYRDRDQEVTPWPVTCRCSLGWVKQRLMLGYGAGGLRPGLRRAGAAHRADDAPAALVAVDGVRRLPDRDLGDAATPGSPRRSTSSTSPRSATPRCSARASALLSLPLGERITAACYYLGSVLILGTTPRDPGLLVQQSYYGTDDPGPAVGDHRRPGELRSAATDRYVYGGTPGGRGDLAGPRRPGRPAG